MVGVIGENLLGAVELFEQQAANQQMRPSHRPERQHGIGALDDHGTEAVGAADRKGDRRNAAVAPHGKAIGELAAGPGGAPLIERDEAGIGGQRRQNQLGLALFQLVSRQAAFFFQFGDDRRRRDAAGVKRLQIIERSAPQPADG